MTLLSLGIFKNNVCMCVRGTGGGRGTFDKYTYIFNIQPGISRDPNTNNNSKCLFPSGVA